MKCVFQKSTSVEWALALKVHQCIDKLLSQATSHVEIFSTAFVSLMLQENLTARVGVKVRL